MSPLDTTLLNGFWRLVAHRGELAEPGAFLRLDWALGDLVLHNDEGQIVAFDNVCPHRGGRFFVEDHGVGRAVCPYHGWSYRGGQVRVPLAKTFPPGALDKVALRRFQTAWCGDFLFVGIAPAQTLEDQLAGKIKPGYETAVAAFLDSSARVNRQIFDEDHAICARVSPHYDLTSADRVFSPGETRVARLHAILTAMTQQEDLP